MAASCVVTAVKSDFSRTQVTQVSLLTGQWHAPQQQLDAVMAQDGCIAADGTEIDPKTRRPMSRAAHPFFNMPQASTGLFGPQADPG